MDRDELELFERGLRMNDSPEWTGSVSGSYRTATFRPGIDLVFSSNFAYGSPRSLRFLTAGALTETRSEAMRLLKASVGLESDRIDL